MRRRCKNLHAFTLVELVVVIMILGILAAIAAPRLLGASNQAFDNAARQSLGVVRNAIDKYTAEHAGAIPGADGLEDTFKTDIKNYLRGQEFPTCPVAAKNNAVNMVSGSGPIAPSIGGTSTTHSWAYQFQTGDFYINSDALANDGVTTYDKF
jgi:prepilin-type N-terminal cleavage/methylation domain-containing protein